MAKQTFTTGQVLTAAQMTSLQQTAMGGGSATAKTASYTLVAADAGTTVIMNSASATTITVNTSLFAAGDTVFIQNIGAGVSTITAGTATVNTASSLALAQYESGSLYFTAAGTSIFSKADGAAAGGGSGLTLIDEVSFSASNAVNVNDVFSATYNNYRILIVGRVGTLSTTSLRYRVGGADETNNYQDIRIGAASGSVTTENNTVGNDEIFLGTLATAADAQSLQTYDIASPYLAKQTSLIGLMGITGTYLININCGVQTDSTSFTGFTLVNGSSGMTGKVSVYGYAKE